MDSSGGGIRVERTSQLTQNIRMNFINPIAPSKLIKMPKPDLRPIGKRYVTPH